MAGGSGFFAKERESAIGTIKLIRGDALRQLQLLPTGSADCCVTSPPYWGMRDYKVAGQIGLEKSPVEYAARLVEVFAQVGRVLCDAGTLWLNLGDCYATGTRGYRGDHGKDPRRSGIGPRIQPNRRPIAGLKRKDLVGIPWRVAFAMQDYGWHLRCDVVWEKPNAMTESMKDRPSRSHEYLFLLTKQERYYYDAAAIEEPAAADTVARYARGRSADHKFADGGPGNQTIAKTFEHMLRPTRAPRPGIDVNGGNQGSGGIPIVGETRNARSVWRISTAPFKGAHFATMPPALAERCILAGSPIGGTVLDPFAGVCTTLLVARRLCRRAIGIELSAAYVRMGRRRLAAG